MGNFKKSSENKDLKIKLGHSLTPSWSLPGPYLIPFCSSWCIGPLRDLDKLGKVMVVNGYSGGNTLKVYFLAIYYQCEGVQYTEVLYRLITINRVYKTEARCKNRGTPYFYWGISLLIYRSYKFFICFEDIFRKISIIYHINEKSLVIR